MTTFIALAGLMTLLALGLVLRRARASTASRAATNAMIYAAEIQSIERDFADGRISEHAYRAARDEILRRVVEDSGEDSRVVPRGRLPVAGISIGVPAVAVGLYLLVGNPAAVVQPTEGGVAGASRPALEAHLRSSPRDARAWIALARAHMESDRYQDAARAYEQAMAASDKAARDPQVLCELADAIGMAQGGTLRGRPRELIDQALALKADHPRALEMAGSAAYEAGSYRDTLVHWTALLAQLSPDSLEYRELQIATERVRQRLPAGATGG